MDEMIESTGTIEDAIRDLLNSDDEAARDTSKRAFSQKPFLLCFTPGAMPDSHAGATGRATRRQTADNRPP